MVPASFMDKKVAIHRAKEIAEFRTRREFKLCSQHSFEFEETLRTRGSGFNAKLGVIVRPLDFLRIG